MNTHCGGRLCTCSSPMGSWCMRTLIAVGAAAAVPSSFDGGGCCCCLVVVLGCLLWPWMVVTVAGFDVVGTHCHCGHSHSNVVAGCCGCACSCVGSGCCRRGRWWLFCMFAWVGGWWLLWAVVLFVVHLSWSFVFTGSR